MHFDLTDVIPSHSVYRQAIGAQSRDHFRQFVLHERVGVVRPTRQKDEQASVLFTGLAHFVVGLFHGLLKLLLCLQGCCKGLLAALAVNAQRPEIGRHLLFQGFKVFERYHRGINGCIRAHAAANHVGIARHDGTIKTVLPAFGRFKHDVRHEYAVDLLLLQIEDVAVEQLGRETDIVGHHRFYASLITAIDRGIRQHHFAAHAAEQGMPEGIIFIHSQGSGNADAQGSGGRLRLCTVEEQPAAFLIKVDALGLLLAAIGKHALALISRKEGGTIPERVTVDVAMILATATVEFARGVGGIAQHFRQREMLTPAAAGIKGATIGAHQFGAVAATDGSINEQLQRPHHRVVVHRSALHHHPSAQF